MDLLAPGLKLLLAFLRDPYLDPYSLIYILMTYSITSLKLTWRILQMIIHHTEETIDILLLNLQKDTSVLTKWFKDNYFCMNADKCHLLICNYDKMSH